MGTKIHEIDRFHLWQAIERAGRILSYAGISTGGIVDEFGLLAEREPIPDLLRESYGAVAEILRFLKSAIEKAHSDSQYILLKADERLRGPLRVRKPNVPDRAAILRAARTVEKAERQAREMIDQIAPRLQKVPWSKGMEHVNASHKLLLGPGPEFRHYRLEDTDFNLLENPSTSLMDGINDRPWSPFPSGPLAELGSHGWWLDFLEGNAFNYSVFPMVRTVYVDFEFGTGLKVPRK